MEPTLRRGSQGEWVTYLQQLLEQAGYPGAVDGNFGAETLQAVQAFQSARGLNADGVVGPSTWAVLTAPANSGTESNVPEGAPVSEDGQWWWDGSEWQPISGRAEPGSGAGAGDMGAWPHFKTDVVQEAKRRLSDLNQLITTTVTQFHDDAITQVESLEGPSDDKMCPALFSALTDALAVLAPGPTLLEMVIMEGLKTFAQQLVDGLADAQARTSEGRLANAKDELRRVVDELAFATRQSCQSAWFAASAKVGADLEGWFQANPEYRTLPFNDDPLYYVGWISDQIGIREAWLMSPGPDITAALWKSFNTQLGSAAAKLRWANLADIEKLSYLSELEAGDRARFLTMVGADHDWWEAQLRSWRDWSP